MSDTAPRTLVDAIDASLKQALRTPDGVAPPAALLWTDADGQWAPLIPTLQKVLPQLYVLGAYAPVERRGPVIWFRCVVERSLPEVSPPDGVVPILYLPKVSRQDLRAGGDAGLFVETGSDGISRFYAFKKLRLAAGREPYMYVVYAASVDAAVQSPPTFSRAAFAPRSISFC